jgi:hypothetical protein
MLSTYTPVWVKINPYLKSIWKRNRWKTSGTWSEIFGLDADEVFMAWYFARYVDSVAAAGKEEYPIPMYVNAWAWTERIYIREGKTW